MDGEEQAHAEDGHRDHKILVPCTASGQEEQNIKSQSDDQRRYGIDLADFPQPDAKQCQHRFGLLIKGISQQAVVAVDEKRPCEAGSTVDKIQNKGPERQGIQNHELHLWTDRRKKQQACRPSKYQHAADAGNDPGGFPEEPPVAFHKQVIEIFKALFMTGNSERLRNQVVGIGLSLMGDGVHSVKKLHKHLLIELAIGLETEDFPDTEQPQGDHSQQQPHGELPRQDIACHWQPVGRHQDHRRNTPTNQIPLRCCAFVPIKMPQFQGHLGRLAADDAHREQQFHPQRHAVEETKQQGKWQKANKGLDQPCPEKAEGIGPGVHPQKGHGVISLIAGLGKGGVDESADHRQEQ